MTRISSILIALAISGTAVSAETVIVNAGVGVSEVPRADVEAMFDGKKANWANGAKVVLVTQPDAAVHEAFLKNYVGKSPAQFATTWKKIVFTGKANAPATAKTDAEVVALVAKSPGAIGYLGDAAAATGNAAVTVVSVK